MARKENRCAVSNSMAVDFSNVCSEDSCRETIVTCARELRANNDSPRPPYLGPSEGSQTEVAIFSNKQSRRS